MIKKGIISGLCLFMVTLGFAFLKTETEREVRIADSTPQALILFDDGNSVSGWLSGGKASKGETVKITLENGEPFAETSLDNNNTFYLNYSFTKAQRLKVTTAGHTQSIRIAPTVPKEKSAFYVIDRSVYRPGDKLKFAAFLRDIDKNRDFQIPASTEVIVEIKSVAKKFTAHKIKLTSDSFGRIQGKIALSKDDMLDDYELSIKGFSGKGKFKIADFRKSKVKLHVNHKLDRNKLWLKFNTLDFLNKPVKSSKVTWSIQVKKSNAGPAELPLKSEDFAFYKKSFKNFEQFTDEQKLLIRSGLMSLFDNSWNPYQAIHQSQGQLKMNAKGSANHELTLDPEWIKGSHIIQITAVVVDYNGREQRTTKSIAIGQKTKDCNLLLDISHSEVTPEQPVSLKVTPLDTDKKPTQADSVVMLVKLRQANNSHFYNNYYGYYSYRRRPRIQNQVSRIAERDIMDIQIVKNGTVSFTPNAAGPYMLVCHTTLEDGTKLINETPLLVHNKVRPLIFTPSKLVYSDKEQINGILKSQIQGYVLATFRDSAGIKFMKEIPVRRGNNEISFPLVKGLKYGTQIQFTTVKSNRPSTHSALVRINPTDKFLTVTAKAKQVYKPGQTVEIELDVNRQEQVDLVVSVFDQSLLGIAADKNAKPESFFFADDTLKDHGALLELKSLLNGMTLEELLKKAESSINKDNQTLLSVARHVRSSKNIHASHFKILLDYLKIGVDTNGIQGSWYTTTLNLNISVFDILQRKHGQWQIKAFSFADTIYLIEVHDNHITQGSFSGNAISMRQGYGAARGDARFSATMNSSVSHISGQALHSVTPQTGAPDLGGSDTGDSTIRRDFSDSAFWNAKVRTDKNGKAKVSFKLPDSLTNWQIVVTAISKDMHVGQGKTSFKTFKPVMVWPMLPRSFTVGDKVWIYGSVHNRSDKDQLMDVSVEVNNGTILNAKKTRVMVPAKGNIPVYWQYAPDKFGFTEILMSVNSAAGKDASLKRLPVRENSVTSMLTVSGLCAKDGSIFIPKDIDLKNASLEVTIVPTIAEDMLDSIDYLVQYPYGCVEQTMSRFLPAIKVAQTLKLLNRKNEALEVKLPKVVEAGIKRLLQLQAKNGGWGWHGGNQTHELMTPYALFGLLEAENAGYEIPSPIAVERGLAVLKGYVDSLHSRMDKKRLSDAIYCIYVYSMRKELSLDIWKRLDEISKKNDLSDYAKALLLEMAVKKGKKTIANRMVSALSESAINDSGTRYWTTANFSRWGNDPFEITAVVLKALVAYNADNALIPEVLNYFIVNKRGNRWNSTKDTAMIIFALSDYVAAKGSTMKDDVKVAMKFNNKNFNVKLRPGHVSKVEIPIDNIIKGNNQFSFKSTDNSSLYRVTLKRKVVKENISPESHGLTVTRRFYLVNESGHTIKNLKNGDTIEPGSYVKVDVNVNYPHNRRGTYVLVSSPRPSGSEIIPETDKRFPVNKYHTLREDKTNGCFFHIENGYYSHAHTYFMHVELNGKFIVPPAESELLYDTKVRGHSSSFKLNVGK